MTWLDDLLGSGISSAVNACGSMAQQNAAQATQYGLHNLSAQQAYTPGGQGMSQGIYQGTNWQPPKWMFDGAMMNVIDFANKIWPEDCADKTAFVLKYSE